MVYLNHQVDEDPGLLRARIMALGRFNDLRRKRDGEIVDAATLLEKHQADFMATLQQELDNPQAMQLAYTKLQNDFKNKISVDLVADYILACAVEEPEADPFLRDAFTRGLERLGPAGLEAVVKAIGSEDKARSGVALYALQGWRSAEGLDALMAEATSPRELSPSARIGLFRALRELGEAVPPEPIAAWLSANPKAGPGPRASAIRVLTAMGARAGASVQPIVVGLLADDHDEVRVAALPLAGMVRSDLTKQALIRIAQQDGLTGDQRRLAFAALRSYSDPELAPIYLAALKNPGEPALRGEVLRALAALDFAQGAEVALSLLADPNREVRAEAIAVLGQKPSSALQVVTLYNAGKLPKEDLSRESGLSRRCQGQLFELPPPGGFGRRGRPRPDSDLGNPLVREKSRIDPRSLERDQGRLQHLQGRHEGWTNRQRFARGRNTRSGDSQGCPGA
jgi:hypothetical protein